MMCKQDHDGFWIMFPDKWGRREMAGQQTANSETTEVRQGQFQEADKRVRKGGSEMSIADYREALNREFPKYMAYLRDLPNRPEQWRYVHIQVNCELVEAGLMPLYVYAREARIRCDGDNLYFHMWFTPWDARSLIELYADEGDRALIGLNECRPLLFGLVEEASKHTQYFRVRVSLNEVVSLHESDIRFLDWL